MKIAKRDLNERPRRKDSCSLGDAGPARQALAPAAESGEGEAGQREEAPLGWGQGRVVRSSCPGAQFQNQVPAKLSDPTPFPLLSV